MGKNSDSIDYAQSPFRALFKLLEKSPKPDPRPPRQVKVDFDTDTNAAVESAIEKLQKVLEDRKKNTNPSLISKQLDLIAEELDNDRLVPLSIAHLELYKSYLGRLFPTDELRERVTELKGRVDQLLRQHPLAAEPRSGDCEDTEETGAVVQVPIRRRRQTAMMLMTNFFTAPLILMFILWVLWWVLPEGWFLMFALTYYVCVAIDNTFRPFHGPKSRMSMAYRNSEKWQYLRDYFPQRIVRRNSSKYDPEKNYLFCVHPHGVQAIAVSNFLASVNGFPKLFPGLKCTAQTLPMNFWMPFMREHCIALGAGNASKKAITQALTWCKGASTVLFVGGAKEALYARPHGNQIVLKDRVGFIKMAIRTGAALVPCYSFGENSLYRNLAGDTRPRLLKWQRRVQRLLTFAPLLVAGRGLFSYSGGLIPFRRPITTVVGDPIDVTQDHNPSPEMVEQIHAKYQAALEQLFNDYRDIYDPKAEDITFI
eukprot:Sspe_Gene.10192::Locus_3406_Transcript_2_3_Confidence_0.400_Length_2656::g.10192::m.10192